MLLLLLSVTQVKSMPINTMVVGAFLASMGLLGGVDAVKRNAVNAGERTVLGDRTNHCSSGNDGSSRRKRIKLNNHRPTITRAPDASASTSSTSSTSSGSTSGASNGNLENQVPSTSSNSSSDSKAHNSNGASSDIEDDELVSILGGLALGNTNRNFTEYPDRSQRSFNSERMLTGSFFVPIKK